MLVHLSQGNQNSVKKSHVLLANAYHIQSDQSQGLGVRLPSDLDTFIHLHESICYSARPICLSAEKQFISFSPTICSIKSLIRTNLGITHMTQYSIHQSVRIVVGNGVCVLLLLLLLLRHTPRALQDGPSKRQHLLGVSCGAEGLPNERTLCISTASVPLFAAPRRTAGTLCRLPDLSQVHAITGQGKIDKIRKWLYFTNLR